MYSESVVGGGLVIMFRGGSKVLLWLRQHHNFFHPNFWTNNIIVATFEGTTTMALPGMLPTSYMTTKVRVCTLSQRILMVLHILGGSQQAHTHTIFNNIWIFADIDVLEHHFLDSMHRV